ncbi:MAG TPA: sigma-70 family RNA polymerase sigma factor [Puia sp.]|jgi:RNA polymerase sigma factor (sigma-70 family)|nr:sigma-70 family RNA polymerase sigma factor [Puia sp.]
MWQAETIPFQMTGSNANSISAVVKAYSRRLMGFIRKRVTNEADAEDILQDVFYQLLGNKEPIDQITAWLFTVARNKIIDRNRKKKPLELDGVFSEMDDDVMGDWVDLIMDDSSNPETIYLRNLFQETLKESLDELPEEQKQAFILNELEGIPFRQISEETGIPVNTLISRKRYAVLHLRMKLTDLHEALKNY